MRQKNETATSFNQLKEITQIMHTLKPSAQTSENANTSEPTQTSAPKPKATAHAKNHALKPTKRAFSERQNTAHLETTHKPALIKSQETQQCNQQGDNTNAFKSDEANTRGQQ